ncbi:MAG: hypothetical protein ACOYMA_17745 [Bacteroidia bacterium]
MKKIKSRTFINSYTNEHLVTVTLYKLEIGYAILSEIGYKLNGETRLSEYEAVEYFDEVIKGTIKAFHSMEQPFHTTETI